MEKMECLQGDIYRVELFETIVDWSKSANKVIKTSNAFDLSIKFQIKPRKSRIYRLEIRYALYFRI